MHPQDPQHVILFAHFRELLVAAASQNIDVAPLKGAHLITTVYEGEPSRGKLSDIDFLVRACDFVATCELLTELGFERKPMPGRPATDPGFYQAGYYKRLTEEHRILFEPHRELVQIERHPIDYDALWRRSVESTFDGAPCRRLSVEDHVLHSIIHVATHRFANSPRAFRDLELLVRRAAPDIDIIATRAREWQCATPTWFVMSSLAERMRRSVDPAIAALAPPAAVRAALRVLVPRAERFRFAGVGLRLEQLLLWPWLADGVRPLVRFGRHYARLRIADAVGQRRTSASTRAGPSSRGA